MNIDCSSVCGKHTHTHSHTLTLTLTHSHSHTHTHTHSHTHTHTHSHTHLPSVDGASHLFERGLELSDVVVFAVGVPVPHGALRAEHRDTDEELVYIGIIRGETSSDYSH